MNDWRSRATVITPPAAPVIPQEQLPPVFQNVSMNNPPNIPMQGAAPTQGSDWRSRAKFVEPTTQASDWRSRAKFKEPGFTDRVKQNYADREKEIANIRANAGNQTGAETLFQGTMATANQLLVDPVAEAVSTVTPDFIKRGVSREVGDLVNLAGKIPAGNGRTLGEVVPEQLDLFSQNYPRATRNIKAVGQGLNLVGTTTGLAAGAGSARNLVNKASDAAFDRPPIIKVEGSNTPVTTKDAAKIAGQNYDLAEWMGAKFTPDQVSTPFETAMRQVTPKPLPNGKLTAEGEAFANSLKDLQGIGGKDLTLGDIDNMNKALGQKINKHIDPRTGNPDADGMAFMGLQTKLRKLVDDVPDTPGNDALVNGRNAWRTKVMMGDLELIAERASIAPGDKAKALQAGYRTLYNDKDRIAGWPKEAVALLKKAAEPNVATKVLTATMPRLLSLITGATGNAAGAVGSQLAAMAGGTAAEAIAGARGAAVQRSLGEDLIRKLRNVDVPEPEYPEQLQLAAPGKLSPLPMTDRQVNIAQQLMNRQPAGGVDMSGVAVKPEPTKLLTGPEDIIVDPSGVAMKRSKAKSKKGK